MTNETRLCLDSGPCGLHLALAVPECRFGVIQMKNGKREYFICKCGADLAWIQEKINGDLYSVMICPRCESKRYRHSLNERESTPLEVQDATQDALQSTRGESERGKT